VKEDCDGYGRRIGTWRREIERLYFVFSADCRCFLPSLWCVRRPVLRSKASIAHGISSPMQVAEEHCEAALRAWIPYGNSNLSMDRYPSISIEHGVNCFS
jgi:hypothetical protein